VFATGPTGVWTARTPGLPGHREHRDDRARAAEMTRRNEYTGEMCECGRPLYVRVVTVGARPESRRGPSCWNSECSIHRR